MADRLPAAATLHMERHVAFVHEHGALRHLPAATTKPGTVTAEGGDLTGPFDAVLLALPSPQAAPLLAAIAHPFAAAAARTVIAPCWAVMAVFDQRLDLPDTQRPSSGPLGWIARDSARPGHAAGPEAWVLHATADWSRAHLEDGPDSVIEALLQAFPASAKPVHVSAHRWRYALVETPLGQSCLWDPAASIGLCGDWCLGPRIEAAYDSGVALARAVLAA